jgi:hypothetical protein
MEYNNRTYKLFKRRYADDSDLGCRDGKCSRCYS